MPWGWIALVLLALAAGVGLYYSLRKHGELRAEVRELRKEADDADQILEVLTEAIPSVDERARAARRQLRERRLARERMREQS